MGGQAIYSPGAQPGRVCLSALHQVPITRPCPKLGACFSSDTALSRLQLGLTLTGPLGSLFLAKTSNQTCESWGPGGGWWLGRRGRGGTGGQGLAASPGGVREEERVGTLENLGLGLRPGARSGERRLGVGRCWKVSLKFRNGGG